MKTAEITKSGVKGKIVYDFDLFVDGRKLGMAYDYHPTKEVVIQILKDHFPQFEIVDKTEE